MGEPALVCNELEALNAREQQDYSWGHQVMYLAPVMMLSGKRFDILDVGFGIGFGLRQMIGNDCFRNYVGYEPCEDSFRYVADQFGHVENVELINAPFEGSDWRFDYSFCIEVIEHVERDAASLMLERIKDSTNEALFLSTPDVEHCNHGVYTEAEMAAMLKGSGFGDVAVIRSQWTKLYIAQVENG